jgi:adenylate cyclase
VNQAARITDLAKASPERVMASAATVVAAGDAVRGWVPVDEVVLRGRTEATTLFAPVPR